MEPYSVACTGCQVIVNDDDLLILDGRYHIPVAAASMLHQMVMSEELLHVFVHNERPVIDGKRYGAISRLLYKAYHEINEEINKPDCRKSELPIITIGTKYPWNHATAINQSVFNIIGFSASLVIIWHQH